MTISGVECAPLLLGQVQSGAICGSQRESLIEELMLRGFDVDPKELMTKLKKKLVEDEQKNTTDPTIKNYFFPRFLTATHGHKDLFEEALAKIVDARRRRAETI